MSHHRGPRVAVSVCGTLRHVSRRRASASLPSYRAVPTRERVALTHREIVAAAVHAFRVRGYPGTTMATVAAVAGVSPRTLYRYFGSKSELFAATIVAVATDFLDQLSVGIHELPLLDAILNAFERTNGEMDEEIREMMRIASNDEEVWRYFLGATNRLQPALAVTLKAAAGATGACSPAEDLVWDVRSSALLGAIATAYRLWATTTDLELSDLIGTAVATVLPSLTASGAGPPQRKDPTGPPSGM
jgi:AcrR family transcriptional regulator